mmetsp:Transcript_70145/g.132270  ORF Transcript_70145/g.132270 Transcript_70145/m.132270 type:complete len:257 (-) Transcript_70145:717-1487(-)
MDSPRGKARARISRIGWSKPSGTEESRQRHAPSGRLVSGAHVFIRFQTWRSSKLAGHPSPLVLVCHVFQQQQDVIVEVWFKRQLLLRQEPSSQTAFHLLHALHYLIQLPGDRRRGDITIIRGHYEVRRQIQENPLRGQFWSWNFTGPPVFFVFCRVPTRPAALFESIRARFLFSGISFFSLLTLVTILLSRPHRGSGKRSFSTVYSPAIQRLRRPPSLQDIYVRKHHLANGIHPDALGTMADDQTLHMRSIAALQK